MRVFFVTWELLREISAVQFLSPSGTEISPFTATPASQTSNVKQHKQAIPRRVALVIKNSYGCTGMSVRQRTSMSARQENQSALSSEVKIYNRLTRYDAEF